MSAFAKLLRYAIEANGQKNQKTISRELGCSRSFMCGLCAGTRWATLQRAQQLAFILDADDCSFLEARLQDEIDAAGLAYRVTVRRTERKR